MSAYKTENFGKGKISELMCGAKQESIMPLLRNFTLILQRVTNSSLESIERQTLPETWSFCLCNTWGVQVVRYPNIFLREWKRIEAWKLLEETWLFFRLGEANNPRYGFKEKGFYFSTSFAFHLVFLLERNFTSLIEKNTTFYYCRPCQSVVRVLHEKLYCLLVPACKTEHFSLCNFS